MRADAAHANSIRPGERPPGLEVAAMRTSRVGDERGQVVVLLVVALLGLLGMVALVVDLGYLYWNQRALQSTADAAALAGAMELPDRAKAEAVAKTYGTGTGAVNHNSRMVSVNEWITSKCLTSIPGCNPVNAVVVDEEAPVNTFFMRLFGLNVVNVKVRATACSPCGIKPLDIMLVLDRTGSMCQNSSGANDPNCTDLKNAQAGMRTFLAYFDPKVDWVGLSVFPPAHDLGSACNTPNVADYDSRSSPYTLVPLSKNYKLSSGALDTNSNLVKTINCIKGGGGTAYANAIEAAQAELDAHGRSDVADVIVFLSDGAANRGPTYYATTSPYRTQPCHQGVTSAGYSKSKGTIVYSIGYALGDDTGGCASYTGTAEKPAITVTQALTSIATNAGNFYNQPTPGQLNTIYSQIAADIGTGTSALTSDTTP
jgi:hypothetical protein